MIHRLIVAAALVYGAGLTPAAAGAQEIPSPYDFLDTSQGVYGYATYILTDRGPLDMGPHSAPAVGAGYSLRISGPFTLDARLAYFPTNRTVYDMDLAVDSATLVADPKADLTEIGEASLSLAILDASLRFDLTGPRTWYNLQPYALVGVGGVLRVTSDNDVEETLPTDLDIRVRFRNGVTGHVGAGVEWHATDRFTLRLDARDVLWKVHIPDGFQRPGRVIETEPWVQNVHLSIGLGFRF